jgi:hypothetical protein
VAHDRAQPELLVADHQIRVQARPQGAGAVTQAEHAGRVGAGRGGHVDDRQASRNSVPDDACHGGGRASDRTGHAGPGIGAGISVGAGMGIGLGGQARYSPGHVDPHRTEPVAAVWHAGGRHRVGDQDQPPRPCRPGHQAERGVVQVHAVGDHLAADLVPVQ